MAAITASMVAELRAKTDAPMMECKKALTEADGDLGRAEELLRVKLGNKASKAASRVTAEGVIASHISGNAGALVELNCETDFVAKNDDFIAFTKQVAELVVSQNPADVAALSALPLNGELLDVGEAVVVVGIDARPVVDAGSDPGLETCVGKWGEIAVEATRLGVIDPGDCDG